MLRVLWLCSWYPNDLSPFEGDFVQRHARTTSLVHKIDVLKVTHDPRAQTVRKSVVTDKRWPNLTETLVYYPYKDHAWYKPVSFYTWQKICRQEVRNYIATYGKPDLVHVHVTLKSGCIASWIKREYGIPFIITERWSGYSNIVNGNSYRQLPFWYKRLIQASWKQASGLQTPAGFLGDAVVQRGYRGKVCTIYNMIDANIFYHVPRAASDKMIFAHISSGVKLKRLDPILEVYEQVKTDATRLIVIGLDEASNAAYQLTHPDVEFLGVVPYEIVAKTMRERIDCLVVFSEVEIFSNVTAEAVSCGVPVIATQNGGLGEYLDERNAILVDPYDPDTLKRALIKMIAERRNFDRQAIAKKAQALFSVGAITEQMDAWYREVAGK
ncbi:glycosyltransferase [Niabella aurantiaca]|uniref:glycosyltransferase n=1 Tax=Niabella aurantiaca TaxID=379900 RepID=UPI0003AA0D81|nr:glycosyltransferase [Niabella aurantiaca]